MFGDVLNQYFSTVYHLAYRMTLSAEDTATVVRESFTRAYKHHREKRITDVDRLGLLVLGYAAEVAQEQQRARDQLQFDELDEMIRYDPTQTGALESFSDPQRNIMLWELKQGCLTAVLNCLPPGERIAFVLSEMLGKSTEEASEILGIKASALRVRISRAQKKISEYLDPRCEHVNPANPCHCPSRIGVALKRGFIGEVRGASARLRSRPFGQEKPAHDPIALFGTLPEAEANPDLLKELQSDLSAGIWD